MASNPVTGETVIIGEPSSPIAFISLLSWLFDSVSRMVWSVDYCPLSVLATLHALKVSLDYRARLRDAGIKESPPLLQGLFTVLTMALGGSTSAALLMGIPPSWLASNTTLLTYTLVYGLVFQMPGDAVYRMLERVEPILRPFLLIADGLTRANTQANFAIESIRSMPSLQHSWTAYLICGTLAGCGGGVIADTLSLTALEWGLRAPGAFRSEQYDLRVSVLSALTYAATTTAPMQSVSLADAWLSGSLGLLTLDPTEARCLAGTLFATAQLLRHYRKVQPERVADTKAARKKKEAAIRASKKHDQTEADDEPAAQSVEL